MNDITHVRNILKNIPIVWINLNRANERRKNMNNLFEKYNLENTRIEAIDGNDINIEEMRKDWTMSDWINKYEVACTLSHIKTIRQCYKKNMEYVLILEDDANFEYFKYKNKTLENLLNELIEIDGDNLQLSLMMDRRVLNGLSENKLTKGYSSANAERMTEKEMMDLVWNTK